LKTSKDLLNFNKVFIYQNLLFKDSDKLSLYFKLGISVKFPINSISYKNKIRFNKKLGARCPSLPFLPPTFLFLLSARLQSHPLHRAYFYHHQRNPAAAVSVVA
jgi:hypothetical protein